MLKIPATLLLALLPTVLLAQSSVWKVSKGNQSLYIGGTCHMLRTSDYPLPPEFDIAYAASQKLFFQIDPAVAEDTAFGMQLLAATMYTDGTTLKSVLSPEAYTALEKQCQASGQCRRSIG